jgi:hypothetical protein
MWLRLLAAGACAATCATEAGCANDAARVAEARAVRELRCQASALRVQAIGELRVLALGEEPVWLFEAHGCDQWQFYACANGRGESSLRCGRTVQELPYPAAHPALQRALDLLRTTARARCPESELRVDQESASLYRYEACDGTWIFHCRARGCERISGRLP